MTSDNDFLTAGNTVEKFAKAGLCLECGNNGHWEINHQARQTLMDAFVPAIWPFEIANALLVRSRRGRISVSGAARVSRILAQLNPVVDGESHRLAMTVTATLAAKHSLSIYDASYVELALRRRLPIASRDAALNAAARKLKLRTLL